MPWAAGLVLLAASLEGLSLGALVLLVAGLVLLAAALVFWAAGDLVHFTACILELFGAAHVPLVADVLLLGCWSLLGWLL